MTPTPTIAAQSGAVFRPRPAWGGRVMGGEFIMCDSCQGWMPSECGFYCTACDGTGQIWLEYPDEDDDYGPDDDIPTPAQREDG